MPIPTRSASVREPRQQTTPGTSRIATRTTSTTAANPTPRRSSTLLPLRGSREEPSPSPVKSQTQTPSQESRLPRGPATGTPTPITTQTRRRGLSQQEDGKRTTSLGSPSSTTTTSGGSITRRQSLIKPKPSPLKTSSTSISTTSSTSSSNVATPTTSRNTAVPASGATSPRKRELPRPQTSPRKVDSNARTDMPPPALPRHGRSISLRQPPSTPPSTTTGSGTGGSATIGRTHTRHHSQGIATASSKLSSPVKRETEGTPRGKVPSFAAQSSPKTQQSSPKKVPASRLAGAGIGGATAATAAAVAAATATETDMPSSWPEVAMLQTELLHLHLYHSSSLQQHNEWQTESEAQLRKKYNSVAQTYRSIVHDEQYRQRCLNGQALSVWLGNVSHTSSSTSDQIAHLSQIIQEVTDLTDPIMGEYTQLLQTFDAWFHKADEIRKIRRQLDADAASGLLVFIDPLDDYTWRDGLEALSLKIDHCMRQLQSLDILGHLGDVSSTGIAPSSALVRTMCGLDELLLGLSKEIAAVKRIEKDIVKAERAWVTKITEQFCSDASSSPSGMGTPRPDRSRGALWRTAVSSSCLIPPRS